jgi:hypothetical protein
VVDRIIEGDSALNGMVDRIIDLGKRPAAQTVADIGKLTLGPPAELARLGRSEEMGLDPRNG